MRSNSMAYKIVCILWLLFLFEPARLMSHYATYLNPLKWLPELLLYSSFVVLWIMNSADKAKEKDIYPCYTALILLLLYGTVIAFILGNWGIARMVNRLMLSYYTLGLLTLYIVKNINHIRGIFLLYYLHLIFFAAWGAYSLEVNPITAYTNIAAREIIPWHQHYVNRDAFGPLMVLGLAFSCYYGLNREYKVKAATWSSVLLFIIGIVLSHARATFFSMIAAISYIGLKSNKKLVGFATIILFSGLVIIISALIAGDTNYWDIMQSSFTEGMSSGTGQDRKFLWTWAWQIFLDYPIFGVGTGNAGIHLPNYVPEAEAIAHGYNTLGHLWARSLHNVPLTILVEYGLIGAIIFIYLIHDFIKTNRTCRYIAKSSGLSMKKEQNNKVQYVQTDYIYSMSMALMTCFIAYWINGIFYEILYTPFLWHILILNRILYNYISSKNGIQINMLT